MTDTLAKTALVTAGGSGMGAACAKALAGAGYKVAVMSSSGKGEALGKELGGVGFTGSVLNPEDVKRFVAVAMDAFGRIDALVNSAGHGPRGDLPDLTDDDWRAGMEMYFLSVERMARLVAPVMESAGGGAIVNISSAAAKQPDPVFPTSAVFRAGLSAYTRLFAGRYASKNVRMNNILPGFVDSFPENPDFLARIPMNRYATVKEVADLVVFLVSDKAAYITGQDIPIDGGLIKSI